MAQTPKFMVMLPPGAPIPEIGFVKAGQIFVAPGKDYVPSLSFRPVNAEAKIVLEKAFDAEIARLSELLKDAEKEQLKLEARQYRRRIEELKRDRQKQGAIIEIAVEQPKVEDGLTLREVAAAEASAEASVAPQKGGDRKL